MAFNSNSTTTIPSSFQIPIAEKLSKTNYMLWKVQVLPPIGAAQMEGLLTGVEAMPAQTIVVMSGDNTSAQPNPECARWVSRDQAVLRYLFSSLTREVLMGVTTLTTTADVWRTLDGMYATRTRARSINTCIALAKTRKGVSTMTEFYSKMKSYADEMVASGQTLGDEEFVAYVLTGLDEEIYNSFVSSIVTRVEPISPTELYSQMLTFELRLMKQATNTSYTSSSAIAVSWGCGAPWTHGGSPSRGRGRSSGSGRGSSSRGSCGGYSNNNNNYSCRSSGGVPSDATGGQDRPRCQVCKKVGPEADICWHIVEMGLTLLATASMPLKYWDQAFLTTTHLINQTPSKRIAYETPLHRLVGATPDYSNLRVFGCACWPNLRPYNSHKL
jgi:hypothetical protein